MALTDKAVKALKPREKMYHVRDDRGLYIRVDPSGSKYWILRVKIAGKEYRRSLGVYPKVGLKDARIQRDRLRLQIDEGTNPFEDTTSKDSFQAVAQEWFDTKVLPARTPGHSRTIISRLRRLAFPFIGNYPINRIEGKDLLPMLRRVEEQGHRETAHRLLQICGQVFRYAIATGKAERDPAADLKGALTPVNPKHHPSITDPAEIGALMRGIDGLMGSFIVQAALKIQAYTFVRPGELRNAEWQEIDLEKAEWRIPAEKMKLRRVHVVPLSTQAVEIFQEMSGLTGGGKYVFPSTRTKERPMSDNTVNAALRRMGYSQQQMTGHGFRSMASTILNENGWPADAIERQLAHVEGNSVRAAYNYAEHLDVRRDMMQWWADWLGKIRGSG